MIMIVDDDDGMAETCSMLLEAHGFAVSIALSGADALSKLGQAPHRLIISDCQMPGMTGVALAERMKADPSTAHLPILLMSASLRSDIAPGSNYDGFLRKPFLAESLLVEVRRLLALPCGR